MLKLLCVAALLISIAASPASLTAQVAQGENGDRPAERLRSDIERAIRNGTPTNSERATLQRALAAINHARAARQHGQPVDREGLEAALRSAEKVFESNSFQPADRQAVQRDMEALRNRRGQ